MKVRFCFLNLIPMLFLGLSHGLAQLAQGPIKIEKIETDLISPFSLGQVGKSRGSSRDGKWLMVEVVYTTTPEEGDFLDEAQFKVMVEAEQIKPGEKQGTAILLTADDTFVYLPKGRDGSVLFFLHPSVVERFGGENSISKKNIRAEVYVKGQLVSTADKKKEEDPNWVNPIPKSGGLVMTKAQSPWASTEAGRFPMAKLRQQQ
jgi:hypothetical protein